MLNLWHRVSRIWWHVIFNRCSNVGETSQEVEFSVAPLDIEVYTTGDRTKAIIEADLLMILFTCEANGVDESYRISSGC